MPELQYLDSIYVERAEQSDTIATIAVPNGATIPLTAAQVVAARVEPAGNTGRSRIITTLEIWIEAQGTVDQYRQYFADSLLAALTRKTTQVRALTEELDRLLADQGAKAVVESEIGATGQKS